MYACVWYVCGVCVYRMCVHVFVMCVVCVYMQVPKSVRVLVCGSLGLILDVFLEPPPLCSLAVIPVGSSIPFVCWDARWPAHLPSFYVGLRSSRYGSSSSFSSEPSPSFELLTLPPSPLYCPGACRHTSTNLLSSKFISRDVDSVVHSFSLPRDWN